MDAGRIAPYSACQPVASARGWTRKRCHIGGRCSTWSGRIDGRESLVRTIIHQLSSHCTQQVRTSNHNQPSWALQQSHNESHRVIVDELSSTWFPVIVQQACETFSFKSLLLHLVLYRIAVRVPRYRTSWPRRHPLVGVHPMHILERLQLLGIWHPSAGGAFCASTPRRLRWRVMFRWRWWRRRRWWWWDMRLRRSCVCSSMRLHMH